MDPLKTALAALAPFANVYDGYARNDHIEDVDLIVRQDGRVLGHAGFTIEDLKRAHTTFLALGGEIQI